MDTTADTKDLAAEKMDVSDPEINVSHSSVYKGDAQKEAIMALRLLKTLQTKCNTKMKSRKSAGESEISPERTQAADPSSHLSREPQL